MTQGQLNSIGPNHEGFFGAQQSVHGLVYSPIIFKVQVILCSVPFPPLDRIFLLKVHTLQGHLDFRPSSSFSYSLQVIQ